MRSVQQIRVFVSSPSDCTPERAALVAVVDEINRTSAQREGLSFTLVCWEDTPPSLGQNPQAVVDHHLGAYSNFDVLVGIMWLRFGTPIPDGAGSGTEHETDRATEA